MTTRQLGVHANPKKWLEDSWPFGRAPACAVPTPLLGQQDCLQRLALRRRVGGGHGPEGCGSGSRGGRRLGGLIGHKRGLDAAAMVATPGRRNGAASRFWSACET